MCGEPVGKLEIKKPRSKLFDLHIEDLYERAVESWKLTRVKRALAAYGWLDISFYK